MSELGERLRQLGKRCRHYDSRGGLLKGADCKIGHPIRQIVTKAAGTDVGMHFMLPCQPGPERAAECADYDPKTDAEVEAERAAFAEHFDKTMALIKAAPAWREKMVRDRRSKAKATCPSCGEKDAVHLSCAIDYNNHLHAKCSECGAGFIE